MPVWLTWNALKGLPWHLIGIGTAIAAVGLYIAILHGELTHVTKQRDGYQAQIVQLETDVKAKTAQALADDTAHARTVETAQNAVSDGASHDYQTDLARITAERDRLRAASKAYPSGSGTANLPGVSGCPSGPDDAAKDERLLEALSDAETNTAQLKRLQDWVNGQEGVKR